MHADSHTQVDGKWLGKAGTEIHLEGGLKIVLEAGAELTLKAGGSWLTINGAGVSADGAAVCLNSGGGPGDGTPAEPLLPEGSVVPDVPPPPKAGCLGVAAQNKKALCLQGE